MNSDLKNIKEKKIWYNNNNYISNDPINNNTFYNYALYNNINDNIINNNIINTVPEARKISYSSFPQLLEGNILIIQIQLISNKKLLIYLLKKKIKKRKQNWI